MTLCPTTGKCRHVNRHTAQQQLRRIVEAGRAYRPAHLGAYQCVHCGGWHLGNQTVHVAYNKAKTQGRWL